MPIFQKSVIQKHLKNLDQEKAEKAFQTFRLNYNSAKIEQIKTLKEEEYQDGFLRDLFVDVLGYTLRPEENYNLQREFKNQTDGKKADGAIIKDEKAIAVIELKSTKTKDLTKVTQQAFNYKNNQPECKYVITSNFHKLRFYIDYANEYEEFDLFQLDRERFNLLYLLLCKENVFSDLPLQLKDETKFHEQEISDKLYKDYSKFKQKLYANLTKNHSNSDKLTLFKKSQKLLDRFLFILFAEDSGLLPPNSISEVIKRFEVLKENDAYKPVYEIFKQYFDYMNIGRKGKTTAGDIPAYNGGLFYKDKELDNFKIDDKILIDDLLNLSEYDFSTEVDVNILGHIFEHSLNEIEEITAEIEGTSPDKTKSKRKKDGVFYTPKYITQYIVENTVGTLCNEKRIVLKIEEIEFDGTFRTKTGKLSEKGKKLYNKLKEYKDWLISLKIIDPACGSGAFLNQALNFLIEEHTIIDDIIAELTNTPLRLFDVDKSILENNLFGVDINEESVEIAQLSLWLRTAQKGRKLSNLNNNIKCGNSLIDDPEIAGDKAFDWNTEFKDIMDNGGFDCVIGNPPYVPTEYIEEKDKEYLEKTYQSAFGRINLYPIFYEKGIKILSKNGMLGFITPYTILKNQYYKESRKFILENTSIKELIDFKGITVFEDAAVDSIIFILKNNKNLSNTYRQISNIQNFQSGKFKSSVISQSEIQKNEDLSLYVSPNEKLIDRITENTIGLKNIIDFNQGVITGANKKFLTNSQSELTKKVLTGRDFNRYSLKESNQYLIYDTSKLHRPRKTKIFEVDEKFLLRQTGAYPICYIDTEQHYTLDTVHNGLILNDKYNSKFLLGLLNSKLLRFFYENQINESGKVFAQVKIIYIDPLPIKETSQEAQQPFIEKSDKMLALNRELQEKSNRFIKRLTDNFELQKVSKKLSTFYNFDFKIFVAELKKQKVVLSLKQQDEWQDYFDTYKTEINQLQGEIQQTDTKIDTMVYELYGLSEEEIKIVEGNQ